MVLIEGSGIQNASETIHWCQWPVAAAVLVLYPGSKTGYKAATVCDLDGQLSQLLWKNTGVLVHVYMYIVCLTVHVRLIIVGSNTYL